MDEMNTEDGRSLDSRSSRGYFGLKRKVSFWQFRSEIDLNDWYWRSLVIAPLGYMVAGLLLIYFHLWALGIAVLLLLVLWNFVSYARHRKKWQRVIVQGPDIISFRDGIWFFAIGLLWFVLMFSCLSSTACEHIAYRVFGI